MTWTHWQLAATLSSAPLTYKHASARPLPPLLFLTDDQRTPNPVAAIATLPQNCAVIFRHYTSPDRIALAERCRQAAATHGHLFLVAGDYGLASAVKADGMHLPDHMAHQAHRLRQRRPHWRITLAAHSTRAVYNANTLDVDAVLASPVFPTQSHPLRASLGPMQLARWCKISTRPVYGLGGVTPSNILRLKGTGLDGIAAIGAFLKP